MNREIKFRGKSLEGGGWVVGDLLHPSTGARIVNYTESEADGVMRADYHYFNVDPATVGQYTGLKDKNGTEIYEGDIITLDTWEGIFVVKFVEGAFCFGNSKSCYNNDIHYVQHAGRRQASIEGNIHDNPELMNN